MPEDRAGTAVGRKRCFVVMGFGVKTDFATGRKLDLDKSYRVLIKPVVEGKSLECIRADEIRHSGSIDVPMYQELLTADVVVADLSTANPNALYELGVRHALRPRTTIVISENKLSYPFDLNHVMITGYTHLGDSIDFDEVMRFRQVLGETIEAVLRDEKTDSPVYTFLSELVPPALGSQRAAEAVAQVGAALQQAGEAIAAAAPEPRQPATGTDPTLAMFVEQGEQAIQENNFTGARAFFEAALQLCKAEGALSHNPYLIQRLALATYKSKQPDEIAALDVALGLLEQLHPNESNDPETVGLAGAVEKRLFDNGRGDQHLSRAIWFYGRGYYLRNDWYNGINLAYLLNVRMSTSLDAKKEERIADLVWANRLRREVLALCEEDLRRIAEREERVAATADKLQEEQGSRDREQKFWCLATTAEAYFGLGELDQYQKTRSAAEALTPAAWMMESFDGQIGKLKRQLEQHAHLLDPPWPGAGTALSRQAC